MWFSSHVCVLIYQAGVYNVEVTARNPFHSSPVATQSIILTAPIINITVNDYGIITRAYEEKTFNIAMDSYGSEMCVAIEFDLSDGIIMLYGVLAEHCDKTNPGLVTRFPGKTFQYVYQDTSQTFNVTARYVAEAMFTIDVYAFNKFTSEEGSFEFPVSTISCSAPNLQIVKGKENFR